MLATLAFVAYFAHAAMGMPGPAAIILGGGLALSSTAVAMQVLQDRGENGSRHGRATFSVLLFQDLAVVVLLMLVPLLAPSDSSSTLTDAVVNVLMWSTCWIFSFVVIFNVPYVLATCCAWGRNANNAQCICILRWKSRHGLQAVACKRLPTPLAWLV